MVSRFSVLVRLLVVGVTSVTSAVTEPVREPVLTWAVVVVFGGWTVFYALAVNRDGIACLRPRFSLPWREFGGARASNGAVWIYQAGVEKPLTATSLRNPNAVLVPPLLATFTA